MTTVPIYNISGGMVWYDAAQQAASTSPLTTITDFSGNGLNATASNGPLYIPASVGGVSPTILFNASSTQYLTAPAGVSFNVSTGFTFLTVTQAIRGTGENGNNGVTGTPVMQLSQGEIFFSNSNGWSITGGAVVHPHALDGTERPEFQIIRYNGSNGQWTCWNNNNRFDSINGIGGATNSAGYTLYAGTGGSFTQASGYFSEHASWNACLSDTQIASLIGLVSGKYNLPAGYGTEQVFVYGDSLGYGYTAANQLAEPVTTDRWSHLARMRPDLQICNASYPGQTLANFGAALQPLNPGTCSRLVVTNMGTNDILGGSTASSIATTEATVVSTIHASGCKAMLETIIDRLWSGTAGTQNASVAIAQTVNAARRAFASGADFLFDPEHDPSGFWTLGSGIHSNTFVYGTDGAHLQPLAYAYLAHAQFPAMNQAIPFGTVTTGATMTDAFASFTTGMDSPANNAFAITPSDTVQLPFVTRSIYVGVGGNVTVKLLGSSTAVTYVSVATGTTLNIRAVEVMATGTTASSLVGQY
jgi:lysophospholipase L1-like esterase